MKIFSLYQANSVIYKLIIHGNKWLLYFGCCLLVGHTSSFLLECYHSIVFIKLVTEIYTMHHFRVCCVSSKAILIKSNSIDILMEQSKFFFFVYVRILRGSQWIRTKVQTVQDLQTEPSRNLQFAGNVIFMVLCRFQALQILYSALFYIQRTGGAPKRSFILSRTIQWVSRIGSEATSSDLCPEVHRPCHNINLKILQQSTRVYHFIVI